jgi:hypothetical protein
VETGVVVALVSGSVAISIPAVTYWLTKRRDHEAAWRDLKLKHYQEFMIALSGVVGARTNLDTRAKYADAANAMSLVAPPSVLRALYEFQDEISLRGDARDRLRHDAKLTALMGAMRADAQGRVATDDEAALAFRLFASGPSADSDGGLDNKALNLTGLRPAG